MPLCRHFRRHVAHTGFEPVISALRVFAEEFAVETLKNEGL